LSLRFLQPLLLLPLPLPHPSVLVYMLLPGLPPLVF
jgi:hypothetical protein